MVFQDLSSGNLIQIGKKLIGLYTCILNVDSVGFYVVALNVCLKPYDLWHRRLGHVSGTVFRKITGMKHVSHDT